MSKRGRYSTAEYPVETRNAIGAISVAMAKDGIKKKKIRVILQNAGYAVPSSTLDDWMRVATTGQTPLKVVKLSGAKKALSTQQMRILAGWTIDQVGQNKEVHGKDARRFIFESWGVETDKSYVSKLYKELGFKSKVCQTKTSGYKLDKETLVEMVVSFLNRLTDKGFFNIPQFRIGSVDFTFTGQRTYRPKSYSPPGL